MTQRSVYLRGGDAWSVAGRGLAAQARACVDLPDAVTVRFQSLGKEVQLPYRRSPGLAEAQEQNLLSVARTALDASGLSPQRQRRIGLFLGTSSGGIAQHERAYAEAYARDPEALPIHLPDQSKPTLWLHRALGIDGPNFTIGTACSSAANAMLYAAWMIREGRLDDALVVGLEIENRLSLQGFYALMLTTRDRCRPFDAQRDGIVLGDCVAALVLSAEPPVGVVAPWELRGGATLCDQGHPTNPSGERIADTLQQALADAGLAADAITAIKAHGTGTRSNDLAEGLGIRQVFGTQPPPFCSLKPVLGHTLGASGALETLAYTACLDQGRLPVSHGFSEVDPELGLTPTLSAEDWNGGAVLLNTFGFGGNNCALVLARGVR